jgi:hypothetical protein
MGDPQKDPGLQTDKQVHGNCFFKAEEAEEAEVTEKSRA